MRQEQWKQVKDFPLYECSSLGKIKNINTKRILRPEKDKNGYEKVILCRCAYKKNIAVHRVVALTFLDNPDNLPQVNHIDGNKTNNCVENLEWCSNLYNIHHAISNALVVLTGENNPNAKLKKETVIKIKEMFATGKYNKCQLARIFGISNTMIRYIVENKSWRCLNENI